MNKKDVLSKGMFKEIVKKGAMFDNGQVVVPLEYDHVSRAKKNLFVGTKGSVNGFRCYGIEAKEEEKGKAYGVYFEQQLKKKALDTEVDFYTIEGKLHVDKKILACVACLNEDMILLLDDNYKWSIAVIDYDEQRIVEMINYRELDSIEMDYSNRRFIVCQDGIYGVVTFNEHSKMLDCICGFNPIANFEPVKLLEQGVIMKDHGKFGFMNHKGQKLLDCIYEEIIPKEFYIEAVGIDAVSIFDYSGRYIMRAQDVKAMQIDGVTLFKGYHRDLTCDLHSLNKRLLPKEFSSIEFCFDGTAILCRDGSYGLVRYDKENDEIVPLLPVDFFSQYPKVSYQNMRFIFNKCGVHVEVKKDNKYAMFSTKGHQISTFS